MKRQGELSINLIILIVIGLLILVILAFVLADKFKNADTAASCIENGGVCKPASQCPSDSEIIYDSNYKEISCSNPSHRCCEII